jgi:hypothetical protein
MPTTSNFGWTTPADTDLVKDGAAAIRTLGNGIDTSFLDLKGGTTGQNLRKASNTDLDFTFAGDATNTVIDAEGDLLVGDSADTLQRLAVGTTGQVLTVDTTLDGKIKWAAPAGGGSTVKIHYANPSADFTSSSATIVDMTGYSITFTPTSATNNILVSCSISFDYNGQIELDVQVDGTTEHRINYYSNTNASQKATTLFRLENLSAASHTIKLRVNPNGTAFTAYGSGSYNFKNNNLMLQEIY